MAFTYPETRQGDHVDTYHGVDVADPYQWLEDPDSEETKAWVETQIELTDSQLTQMEARDKIKARLTDLYNYPKYGCPWKEGDNYYFFKNDGLQNQSVLYTQKSLDADPVVFFDANELSAEGLISLKTFSFSEDGTLFGYALSKSGSDWSDIQLRTVDPDHPLASKVTETLKWCKFTGITWDKTGKGFFYSRYPAPENDDPDTADAGTSTDSLKDSAIYYHRVATPQSEDVKIYTEPEHPQWMYGSEVTDDGAYLIITGSKDTDPINLLYTYSLKDFDPKKGDPLVKVNKLVTEWEAEYSYVTNVGTLFYFKTNLNAPRYKLITIDIANPEKENWKDVLAESDKDVLSYVNCVDNDKFLVAFIRDVADVLELFSLQGEKLHQFELPSLGTITSLTGEKKSNEIFYQFSSFLSPGTIFHYQFEEGKPIAPVVFREIEIEGFDASQFEASQVFYESKDGTKIPMFIVAKKGLKRDGTNPVWLYGYGGFNISLQPYFSTGRIVWMNNLNGIFALANLRGGGEYGEEWHSAGTKEKKQNVFDDFHAAAEYLVEEKYTSPSKITINGGSNGGLLVGACINQRPELYGAAVAAVGVMDMLKFHKFTIGHFWVSDFGSSDDAEGFKYIHAYSPIHNIHPSKPYPAVFLTTADHDDRVSPLHSYKYIAALQNLVGGRKDQKQPLLIRIEKKAGHGAGKPTAKVIAESADGFAFAAHYLNITWVD
eukprot:TRINITY_DN3508_c0_g1_i1.p1 TRINITY_DN3508_c0_g1~~TRINITY_DN3508_c0_g1_i1.p1  ORF type:complete len:758 (-),score=207.38 TRINITY_DN3508_c0_g1_i1:98-2245(-)